jgi:hypothetical protein
MYFAVGDLVSHPVFGLGKIQSVDFAAQSYGVAFDSLPTARSMRFGAPPNITVVDCKVFVFYSGKLSLLLDAVVASMTR